MGLPASSLGIGSTATTTETTPGPSPFSLITGGLLRAPDLISGGKSAYGGLASLGSAALSFLNPAAGALTALPMTGGISQNPFGF